MIRVGIAGAGPWAEMFTLPMLAAAPDLTPVAVWARRRPAAEALAQPYDATVVDSFQALLDACDAVAFAVPADVQAPLAIAAARAGRHLLLEKPIAFAVADTEAVATAADAAGVTTQMMLTYRFTAPVRAFVDALASTRVEYVRTAFLAGGALAGSPFATPWRTKEGAELLDLGPHALDLLEAAAGPIAELRAARSGGVTTVTTSHEGGTLGHVALSVTTPGPPTPPEAEALTAAGRVRLTDPLATGAANVQHTIADEFARAVRGEFRQPLDVHHGVRLQRLIAAVASSLEGGGCAVKP
jgi:predicted dehydrogenase